MLGGASLAGAGLASDSVTFPSASAATLEMESMPSFDIGMATEAGYLLEIANDLEDFEE